jgi:hypothetical protein
MQARKFKIFILKGSCLYALSVEINLFTDCVILGENHFEELPIGPIYFVDTKY